MHNGIFISTSTGGAVPLSVLMAIGLMACDKGKSDSPAGLPSDPSYSLSAPAVDTPAANKAAPVVSPAAAPGASSVSGVWHTSDGEVYSFQQQGSDVLLTLQKNGAAVGTGRGVLNGSILQLSVAAPDGNPQSQSNCAMQAGPDFQSFTGLCSGPRGQYPLHISR